MCCTHIFPFSQENPVGQERTKTDVYKCAVPIYFHFHKKILLDQKEQKQMFINVLYPYIFIFTRNPVGPERTNTDVYKCTVPIYFHFHKKILLDQKEQTQMFINVLYPYIFIFTRNPVGPERTKTDVYKCAVPIYFHFHKKIVLDQKEQKNDVYKCAVPIYFHFHNKIALDQKEQKLMFINVLYPYISIFTRKSCWTRKNKN